MSDSILSAITQKGKYGAESVEGTAVPALKIFAGLGISISPNITKDELQRMGYRFPTTMPTGHVLSGVKISGKPCYSDLSVIGSCVHRKTAGPSTPGGGTDTRLWTFLQSSTLEE